MTGIHDLRGIGKIDSQEPTPEEIAQLRFAPFGAHDEITSRCEPFDRFALANHLKRLAGLLGVAGTHADVTYVDDDGGRVRVDLESGHIERLGTESGEG